ncbi:uncharacterized protein LOC128256045 isoform X4 [Drosophila gunungcola]|uniref:uncharacterized protein LOC128256045 isoform X4 n=1 Tax=Drosophila gunungcola TaxID=103775 RepID=UPI0022E5E401|nr:uncharacterized protein LOC128256045 isoform X4 [Drosophila gunungcola]
MECQKCDTTSNAGDQRLDPTRNPVDLKPETTLEMEIEEALSSSSADDTPPGMIVVETHISCWDKMRPHQSFEKNATLTDVEVPELPACSVSLGRKPNVQFQKLPHPTHPLVSTEASLAAATCPAYAATCTPKSSITESIATLRHCIDGTTQCNNLTYDSVSNESMPSLGSLVCRICHNADNPEQLVSPCLCKGSLTYVHVHCLERWISTSRCTTCELCQFQYNTEQTLRIVVRPCCRAGCALLQLPLQVHLSAVAASVVFAGHEPQGAAGGLPDVLVAHPGGLRHHRHPAGGHPVLRPAHPLLGSEQTLDQVLDAVLFVHDDYRLLCQHLHADQVPADALVSLVAVCSRHQTYPGEQTTVSQSESLSTAISPGDGLDYSLHVHPPRSAGGAHAQPSAGHQLDQFQRRGGRGEVGPQMGHPPGQ